MDLTIVIPCFDESDNIQILADELFPVVGELRRDRSVEVLFVEDGSTDGTGELLRDRFGGDPDVRVARHDRNRGLGAALRTGFKHASGEVVVTTDSDASYPFSLIVPLLDRLQPGVDLVTASCYHRDGGVDNVPGYRIFLSKSASLMYRILVDWNIHTYTCMFRAYRRNILDTLTFESRGFLAVTELLVSARLQGYTVSELPCTLRVRRYGASKAKLSWIILSHLRFQVRMLLSGDVLHRRPSVSPRTSEPRGVRI
jgi:dolichol-phosphate mannosyltransferase